MSFSITTACMGLLELWQKTPFVLRPHYFDGRQIHVALDILSYDVDAMILSGDVVRVLFVARRLPRTYQRALAVPRRHHPASSVSNKQTDELGPWTELVRENG